MLEGCDVLKQQPLHFNKGYHNI